MDSSKLPNSDAGFTLVEALVALTILTVGLIPAFVQASGAVALSATVRNALIASHLAQEGAEVIRGMRDANWIAGVPYDTGLAACLTGCLVEYDSVAPDPLSGNPPLSFDPVTGLYSYGGTDESLFSRSITVTPVSGHELKVVARVDWEERTGPKSFEVEYHLYDWLQLQ